METSMGLDCPFSLREFAIKYITHRTVDDCQGTDYEWYDTLERMDISQSLILRIMDPTFDDVRETGSAKFWVVEAMEGQFGALEMPMKASYERTARGTGLGLGARQRVSGGS